MIVLLSRLLRDFSIAAKEKLLSTISFDSLLFLLLLYSEAALKPGQKPINLTIPPFQRNRCVPPKAKGTQAVRNSTATISQKGWSIRPNNRQDR